MTSGYVPTAAGAAAALERIRARVEADKVDFEGRRQIMNHATQYSCAICGNDWLTTLPADRHLGLCQLCDYVLRGRGPHPPPLRPELRAYLLDHGFERLAQLYDPTGP